MQQCQRSTILKCYNYDLRGSLLPCHTITCTVDVEIFVLSNFCMTNFRIDHRNATLTFACIFIRLILIVTINCKNIFTTKISRYHIAGNFRIVQNFAVFADRLAVTKIRTTKFSIFYLVLIMDYQWAWSCQSTSAKLRTMRFSSEGLGGNSMKFCTSENFPAIWYNNLVCVYHRNYHYC